MADHVLESLIVQLVEWLAQGEQPYEAVMSAWRTSCPRLPIWEDANERGLISTVTVNGVLIVRITPAGLHLLDMRQRHAAACR